MRSLTISGQRVSCRGCTLAEQLTVLLIGFDLTFELRPNDHSIEIVPLKDVVKSPSVDRRPNDLLRRLTRQMPRKMFGRCIRCVCRSNLSGQC